MSRIYDDSHVYCPRAGARGSLDHYSRNAVFPLASLYFCPSCQTPKAAHDCYHNIEGKFCSNCITDYTNTSSEVQRCAKNCFACPACTSSLVITITDHDIAGKLGKAFKFSCVFCAYAYQSQIVTSPKSLQSIIRSEAREASHSQFHHFQHQLGTKSPSPTRDSDTRLKNLSLSGIVAPGLVPVNTIGPEDTSHLRFSTKMPNPIPSTEQYPLARKLTVKRSYKCSSCNTYLLLPHIESGQVPTTNKLRVKYNAVDYMPSVKVTDPIPPTILSSGPTHDRSLKIGQPRTFLINLMNPLSSEIKVHIGVSPTLGANFIKSKAKSRIKVELEIPVPDTVVKPTGSTKNIIKTIPTACLTTTNTISKAELISRLGGALFKDKAPDTSFTSEDSESLMAQGLGWSQLPLIVSIEASNEDDQDEISDTVEIEIPLYITVEAELPPSIRILKLSKQVLSYGYWNIVDLGQLHLTR